MTRKFVYDPRSARVRMVGWTTGSHRAASTRPRRPWRWLLAAAVIVASAWAFDAAAHAARAGAPAAVR